MIQSESIKLRNLDQRFQWVSSLGSRMADYKNESCNKKTLTSTGRGSKGRWQEA